jgi:hypothetical protein
MIGLSAAVLEQPLMLGSPLLEHRASDPVQFLLAARLRISMALLDGPESVQGRAVLDAPYASSDGT